MPKVGDRITKTVVRYGKLEEQTLEFCADGRFHFVSTKPKPEKSKPEKSKEEEQDIFDELGL